MDETIQIPGYKIERNLGSGAMATVYLAEQTLLQRKVALKLMAANLVTDENFRKRFLREGQAVARLNHPNIVTIYDIGIYESSYYMAMEYVDGGATLKEKIQQGITPEQAVSIFCQIGSALGYAHQHGLVHRDVKPANILFSADGTAVLSDFGIVRKLEDDGTQLTQQGFAVGTPAYMSPEQILGKQVDARSDLYSLGVVFHEMLTGDKPFHAEETFALALKHVNEPVPRLPQAVAQFQSVIDNLMAKEPEQRFANADEMIRAVTHILNPGVLHSDASAATAVLSSDDNTVVVDPAAVPVQPERRTHWPLWLMGTITTAAVAGLAGYLILFPPPPTNPPCQSPELTAEEKTQIVQLLEIADINYEVGRLVDPPVSNAAYGYQEVLKIDRCNPQAKQGLNNIAQNYADKARKSLEQKDDPRDSLNLVDAGWLRCQTIRVYWNYGAGLIGKSTTISCC